MPKIIFSMKYSCNPVWPWSKSMYLKINTKNWKYWDFLWGSIELVLILKLFPHSCSKRHLQIDVVAPSALSKTGVVLSVCLSPLKPAQYLDSMELKSAHNEDLVGQFQIEEHALKGVYPPLRDHPPAFGLLIERPQKVWPVNCQRSERKAVE